MTRIRDFQPHFTRPPNMSRVGSEVRLEATDFPARDETPIAVTQRTVLRGLDRICANAETDRSHANAIRAVGMMAQFGLPGGRAKGFVEPRGLSPAALHGLPETSGSSSG